MNYETNRLQIGKTILHFDKVNSTNAISKKLLTEKSITSGTVIVTANQTQGKGQFGNIWHSGKNANLTFSIVEKPVFLVAAKQFLLSQCVAIGLINYFLNYFTKNDLAIKWPNDILIKGKKVCGVLIENSLAGANIQDSIIGIGINVNDKEIFKQFPNSTSLFHLLQQEFDLHTELEKVLNAIDALYIKLTQGKHEYINEVYHQYLFKQNIESDFLIGDKISKGIIMGVNSLGQLQVKIENEIRFFNNKEIQMIY